MEYILSPSILAADFSKLGEAVKQTEESGAKYLHFDVMDGVFVPSISFGMPVMQGIKKCTNQVMDTHLMITEPIRYIDEFVKSGSDMITVHYEACKDLKATLDKIKAHGIRCGISVSPKTPVEVLFDWVDEADQFLIMTVEPGFGGQKLIPETLEKVRKLRKFMEEKNLEKDIEVDGGIYVSNVKEVLDAGANVVVAGSAVFKNDPRDNIREFMEIFKDYE